MSSALGFVLKDKALSNLTVQESFVANHIRAVDNLTSDTIDVNTLSADTINAQTINASAINVGGSPLEQSMDTTNLKVGNSIIFTNGNPNGKTVTVKSSCLVSFLVAAWKRLKNARMFGGCPHTHLRVKCTVYSFRWSYEVADFLGFN